MVSILLDNTLLYQMALLLVIIFLGNVLFLKPVKAVIDKRDEKIKSLTSGASDCMNTVEESKKAYEDKLTKVKSEISSYQIKMREETSKEVENIISSAKESVAKSTEENRKELEKSIAEARAGLSKEVKEVSDMIYKTITGKVV